MEYQISRIQGSLWQPNSATKGAGLVMTATLTPPVAAVARSDPNDRMQDYLDALDYYLSLPNKVIDRILFIDNSNSNLTPLINFIKNSSHDKVVELIGFSGNGHPYQRGKAYGEFKLLDFGLAKTTLFSAEDIVWKTTGRLKFLNLTEMTKQCKSINFDILCDLHNVPWIGSGKWHHHENMDLRVFAFRMRAYDSIFRNIWRSHEAGFDAEFMYHLMRKKYLNLRIIHRFPIQALLQGISGRHERDYSSTNQRRKDAVRIIIRKIIPWIWL